MAGYMSDMSYDEWVKMIRQHWNKQLKGPGAMPKKKRPPK